MREIEYSVRWCNWLWKEFGDVWELSGDLLMVHRKPGVIAEVKRPTASQILKDGPYSTEGFTICFTPWDDFILPVERFPQLLEWLFDPLEAEVRAAELLDEWRIMLRNGPH